MNGLPGRNPDNLTERNLLLIAESNRLWAQRLQRTMKLLRAGQLTSYMPHYKRAINQLESEAA